MARHCSDEQLLALRDGELGPISRFMVARHIRSCWLCRGRLTHLETQVQALAEAWRNQSPKPSEQVEVARRRFLAWARQSGIQFERPGRSRFRHLKLFRVPPLAAAGSLVLAATFVVWQRASEPPAAPPHRPVASPRITVRPPARAPAVPAPAVPLPVSSISQTPAPVVPSASELLEAEIGVRYMLHRAGSCLGEPIEVSVDPGRRVLIRGVVSSLERKRTLTALLAGARGSAWIAIDLSAVEDLPVASDSTPLPPQSFDEAPGPSRDRTFERAVAAYFKAAFPADSAEAIQHRVTTVGNEAISRADAALAEAWALRRLQERFAAESLAQIRQEQPQIALLLETIARDHVIALRKHAHDMREFLNPILSCVPRTEPAAAPPSGAFARIQRMQLLVDQLFGGVAVPNLGPDQATTELLVVTDNIASELRDSEEFIARNLLSKH